MKLKWTLVAALTCLGVPACASAPSPADAGSDIKITLERGPCFGACPIYSVEISGDGTVLWHGQRFVAVVGDRETHVSPEAVAALAQRFRDAKFFELKDEYRADVTDNPTQILSFTENGRTKVVIDYRGESAGMPASVKALEAAVDQTAGVEAFVGHK